MCLLDSLSGQLFKHELLPIIAYVISRQFSIYCRSLYFRVMKFSRKSDLALFREMMNSRPETLANLLFFNQTLGFILILCRFRLDKSHTCTNILNYFATECYFAKKVFHNFEQFHRKF